MVRLSDPRVAESIRLLDVEARGLRDEASMLQDLADGLVSRATSMVARADQNARVAAALAEVLADRPLRVLR